MAYTKTEGLQEQPVGLVVANENRKAWIALANQLKGGLAVYPTLKAATDALAKKEDTAGLCDRHPNRLWLHMPAVVGQHSIGSQIIQAKLYYLKAMPQEAQYPLSLDPVEPNYYLNFWEEVLEFDITGTTVYQYAPDFTNGDIPPFPYAETSSDPNWAWEQANWTPTYNVALRHRWVRISIDGSAFTPPLSFANFLSEDDYIERLFNRENGSSAPALPERFNADGSYNLLPDGWTDGPTLYVSNTTLWEIRQLRNKYGYPKGDYIGPFAVDERHNYTRYNTTPLPDPNTIVGTGTTAAAGTAGNTLLTNKGWINSPTLDSVYRAEREDNNGGAAGPPFTEWKIVRIRNEGGEYTDYRFKLFDIGTDYDSPSWISANTPVGKDPVGWFDAPTQPPVGSTKINFVSRVIKYRNGENKGDWSPPVPFTGESAFGDAISTEEWDSNSSAWIPSDTIFKIAKDGAITPNKIRLTAELFFGNNAIWQDPQVTVSYKWYMIFNNGSIVDPKNQITSTSNTSNAYIDAPEVVNGKTVIGRRAVVTENKVTGKAIFEVEQTVTLQSGVQFVLRERVAVTDLNDGLDAKILVLESFTNTVIEDTHIDTDGVTTKTLYPNNLRINVIAQNITEPLSSSYWEFYDIDTFTWRSVDLIPALADTNGSLTIRVTNFSPAFMDNAYVTGKDKLTFRYAHPEMSVLETVDIHIIRRTIRDGKGDKYSTITNSFTVALGTQTITVDPGLAWTPGQVAKLGLATDPTTYYGEGTVISYDNVTGALELDITSIGSVIIANNWFVNLAGAPGQAGDRYKTVSTTSNAIGTGAKTFTVGTGLAWTAGQSILFVDNAAPATNTMAGTVTSYDNVTGQLVSNITEIQGSGTIANWIVNLSGTGGVGADGADSLVPILSNQTDQIITESDGSVKAGEVHPSDYLQAATKTQIELLEGVVFSDNFTVSVSAQSVTTGTGADNVQFGVVNLVSNKWVYVQHWGANVEKVKATIEISYNGGAVILHTNFTVSRVIDPAGALIPVIESTGASNKGFNFLPTNRNNIQLTARLYDGIARQDITSGVTYQWTKLEGGGTLLGTPLTTQAITVQRSAISFYATVRVTITHNGVNYATTQRIEDLTDLSSGKAYATANYSQSVMNSLKLPSTVGIINGQFHNLTTNVAIGSSYVVTNAGNSVTWKVAYTNENWSITGQESNTKLNNNHNSWTWDNPIKQTGEAGDPGLHGGWLITMYKQTNDTLPAAGVNASVNQMLAGGWSLTLPPAVADIYTRAASFTTGTTSAPDYNTSPDSPGWTDSSKFYTFEEANAGPAGSDAAQGAIYANKWDPAQAIPGSGAAFDDGFKVNIGRVSRTELQSLTIYIQHTSAGSGTRRLEIRSGGVVHLISSAAFDTLTTTKGWTLHSIDIADIPGASGDVIEFSMYYTGPSTAVLDKFIVHGQNTQALGQYAKKTEIPSQVKFTVTGSYSIVDTFNDVVVESTASSNGSVFTLPNSARNGQKVTIVFRNNNTYSIAKSPASTAILTNQGATSHIIKQTPSVALSGPAILSFLWDGTYWILKDVEKLSYNQQLSYNFIYNNIPPTSYAGNTGDFYEMVVDSYYEVNNNNFAGIIINNESNKNQIVLIESKWSLSIRASADPLSDHDFFEWVILSGATLNPSSVETRGGATFPVSYDQRTCPVIPIQEYLEVPANTSKVFNVKVRCTYGLTYAYRYPTLKYIKFADNG